MQSLTLILKHSPLDTSCSPLFKIFFPVPSILFYPFLRYFIQSPPTLTQSPPTLIQHINLPYTQLTNLSKCKKGDFTSSNIAFYQKSIFNFLNLFTNISGYLNLWNIFSFIFRQLKMTFSHKIMVAEKNFFLQMHNTILQRVK